MVNGFMVILENDSLYLVTLVYVRCYTISSRHPFLPQTVDNLVGVLWWD
jgi:hypothetical protein